jgi:hypothetical protein
MTILWSNNASTTVSGSITAVATSVALSAGTGALFPNPTGGNYYIATFYDQATKTVNEIVRVTAMAGDVATIVRAQEGTTAKAWNAGDIFANLVTAGTLNAFVQAGTGPANTSIVYVGTDTSATPGLIVATTNPVPASLAIGMLFNIKVANTNPGTTMMQLNGGTSIETVRTDGSHMIGGNVIAGEEYMFVYNGTNFTSTIMPVPVQPPQTTFYVRTDSTSTVDSNGLESNSGFANTSTSAFKTIQGAINTIKNRYISQTLITVRVADGTYTSGGQETANYIASWNILGNTSTPANVILNCTSTVGSSYVPGAQPGDCFVAAGSAVMTVNGFTFNSYYENVNSTGGAITAINCNFTGPGSGTSPITAGNGGVVYVYGTCQYSGASAVESLFIGHQGGTVRLGSHDVYQSTPLAMTIIGTPTFTNGTAYAFASGNITLQSSVLTFPGGTPVARQYYAVSGGGIWFYDGGTTGLVGNQAGVVVSPGWIQSG